MNPDQRQRSFEREAKRLRGLAARLLGSIEDAEDAVQETWLRFQRADVAGIENPAAWLTTVVSRIALDALRRRSSRREDELDAELVATLRDERDVGNPEREAELLQSVGLALLIVLDRLPPLERVAFVLHDLLGTPFEEVGAALDRTSAAARQLASRARRKVRSPEPVTATAGSGGDELARAFLAAARHGDQRAIMALLDPSVELVMDGRSVAIGAGTVAERASLGAAAGGPACTMRVDGAPAIVVTSRARPVLAMCFMHSGERVTTIRVTSEPGRLAKLTYLLGPPEREAPGPAMIARTTPGGTWARNL